MIRLNAFVVLAALVTGLPKVGWAEPRLFVARLTGVDSIAPNSTPVETRTGTGLGMVMADVETGEIEVVLSFMGLIGQDITPPLPAGAMPIQGLSGDKLNGFGFLVGHFHVGSPKSNGLIPRGLVDPDQMDGRNGKAIGIMTNPDPIQMATAGMITGKFNIRDDAARNMGKLLANVPLDGREDNLRNEDCTDCGFFEGLLSNNTYLNIHTLNNPSGEIRGQLIQQTPAMMRRPGASAQILDELSDHLAAMQSEGVEVQGLQQIVSEVRSTTLAGSTEDARAGLIRVVRAIVSQRDGRVAVLR